MKIVSLTIAAVCTFPSSALADKKPAAKATKTLRLPRAFGALAFSPDGKTIVLGEQGNADIYDRKTMKRKFSITVNRVIMSEKGVVQYRGAPVSIAYSADGKSLALLNLFAEIQIHNAKTGARTGAVLFPRKIEEILGLGGSPQIVFSPDGKQIALFESEGMVAGAKGAAGYCALFETRTGKHHGTLLGVANATATSDGRFLGLRTGPSREIVDLTTRKPVCKLPGKVPGTIFEAAISRCGRFAVLGTLPDLHVWDVRTGQQRLRFRGTKTEIFMYGVTFSNDGQYAMVGSLDRTNGVTGRIRVIRLSDGKVVWKEERFREVPWVFGTTPERNAAAYRFRGPFFGKDRINLRGFPVANKSR